MTSFHVRFLIRALLFFCFKIIFFFDCAKKRTTLCRGAKLIRATDAVTAGLDLCVDCGQRKDWQMTGLRLASPWHPEPSVRQTRFTAFPLTPGLPPTAPIPPHGSPSTQTLSHDLRAISVSVAGENTGHPGQSEFLDQQYFFE